MAAGDAPINVALLLLSQSRACYCSMAASLSWRPPKVRFRGSGLNSSCGSTCDRVAQKTIDDAGDDLRTVLQIYIPANSGGVGPKISRSEQLLQLTRNTG